jgi:hypothetical protein
MAILNGMHPDTRRFLNVLGKVSGGINLLLFALLAMAFVVIGWQSMRDTPSPRAMPEQFEFVRRFGGWLILLGLIMLYTVWHVGSMVMRNGELSGIIGLAALLQALFI